ncbi:MAG: winged helix-turn-helix transcriptional regulator [Janthinobacterium lividum]
MEYNSSPLARPSIVIICLLCVVIIPPGQRECWSVLWSSATIVNQLVKRTVLDTQPITVQYKLTEHDKTLQTIIDNLTEWGIAHHQKIFGQ